MGFRQTALLVAPLRHLPEYILQFVSEHRVYGFSPEKYQIIKISASTFDERCDWSTKPSANVVSLRKICHDVLEEEKHATLAWFH